MAFSDVCFFDLLDMSGIDEENDHKEIQIEVGKKRKKKPRKITNIFHFIWEFLVITIVISFSSDLEDDEDEDENKNGHRAKSTKKKK